MDRTQDRSEVVFFDVETIYATPVIVEFGAILVCPETLTERHNYSTLVRPADPSIIPPVFERRNGITRDALAGAPTFDDIADRVYELLHDRIGAGHNILEHDCLCIREAFSEINRPPPEPKATIDSLPLLTPTFGRRAGDMKLSCADLKIRFGISDLMYYDDAGRPKLDFVVDASQSFCEVLEACEAIAQRFSFGSGSSSDWRPLVVTIKEGFVHYRTVKLRIPISECGDVVRFANKVYKKEPSGTVQKLRFNKSDTTELSCLLKPGTLVDAVISLDPYDYRQKAGIKLVAQKLTIHE